jgi:hypothetical protein
MIVSLQYGLAARNQEVWGLRWISVTGAFAWVTDVLTNGRLEEWGKTELSTGRRILLPSLLQDDLAEWRLALRARGHQARDVDFVIPGDLQAGHGSREVETDACHFSEEQGKNWSRRCFTPAVQKAAERPELARILGATPYALRRGGISLRLRTEDPQTVARECGTSLQMLSRHYSFAIEDLRQSEPRGPPTSSGVPRVPPSPNGAPMSGRSPAIPETKEALVAKSSALGLEAAGDVQVNPRDTA